MQTVTFKFEIDQKVKVTKIGITGVITMCGYDNGGPMYVIKNGKESEWYSERLLEDAEGN
jgi:hypothetical protein